MPSITLPDGSRRDFDTPVSVADIAASIGAGLARAALAGRVDGKIVDTSHVVSDDASIAIVTERDEDGVDIIRHSTAHLLAHAVKTLYPEAQVTIGPVIEDGFYYDFAFERPFTPEDLQRIETEMKCLAEADIKLVREVMDRDEAVDYFRGMGEEYKARIIADIPAGEAISLYRQGDFVDLCRGPHVPSTSRLKAFKLTKVAGAYWRGDSNNEMLQRIYGTAWPDGKQLKAYLHRLEEAERRDHRRIARQQDLFHFQEEAPGMVFWHHKGWTIYKVVEDYMRSRLRHDYQEVNTPQVVDVSLWKRSGHFDKYRENMFFTGADEREYAIKPMNCPCHVQIYNQGLKSYRDLPLRLAEFGSCHRNEPSGAFHGLMRVVNFVQDDAHVFCTEDQIQSEVLKLIDLVYSVYADFGFADVIVNLSTRPANRVGSDAIWDKAEAALARALDAKALAWREQPGEGAFYGPKVDFSLRDCIGRVWQCGTIQVDFSMPERLGAEYVAEDNSRRTPVMLHRAVLGSLHRFIGILIEEFAGQFPPWLAPVQAMALCITERQAEYTAEVVNSLENQGFRARADLRNEKIGLKIRDHTLQRVPYLLVIGDREVESRTVAVRTRGGEDLGSMALDAFTGRLSADIASRGRVRLEDRA